MFDQTNYSRRSVLILGAKTGAAMLALVTAGSDLFVGQGVKAAGHDEPLDFGRLLFFDARQANVIYAFAEATLPHGPGYATPMQARVVNRLDEELTFVSKSISDDYIKIVQAVDLLPRLFGQPSTFTDMTREERLAFLNSTLDTDKEQIRAGLNAMRMAVLMMYYGHESTWKQIHYDGPFAHMPQNPGVQREHYAKLTGGGKNG